MNEETEIKICLKCIHFVSCESCLLGVCNKYEEEKRKENEQRKAD